MVIKMKYTVPVKGKVCASSTMSISSIHAAKVCRALNRKKFIDAKKILDNIINEKLSIEGKYYTKTAKEIFNLLKQLESNARLKGLDADPMFLFISAHRGPTLYRSRRRRKHGIQLKSAHVQVVLSDKNGFGKKVYRKTNKK